MRIYWLTESPLEKLGLMPRPKGGVWLKEELTKLQQQEVDILVSALEKAEMEMLSLEKEAESCSPLGIQFEWFPIPDMNIPESKLSYLKLVDKLAQEYKAGKRIVVHCRQGIGRSSLLAAGILMKLNYSLKDSLQIIKEARGIQVPESRIQLTFLQGVEESINWG